MKILLIRHFEVWECPSLAKFCSNNFVCQQSLYLDPTNSWSENLSLTKTKNKKTKKQKKTNKTKPTKKKTKKQRNKNITKNHALQTKQSTQPPSPISISKSNPLTVLLKPATECKVLIREGSLAHSTGPKYLRECLP